jgi:hypothetical protein
MGNVTIMASVNAEELINLKIRLLALSIRTKVGVNTIDKTMLMKSFNYITEL